MPTQTHSIRVPDDVWKAAQAKALAEGESVSEVVRAALARFVGAPGVATRLADLEARVSQLEARVGPGGES